MFGLFIEISAVQDIPLVKDLQIIPSWEGSQTCPQANADFAAGRTVSLRYQNEQKKKVELSVPAERIHKAATETVRRAMRTQSEWSWVPSCLFVLYPPLDAAVPIPPRMSFLFTALAEENALRAAQKQKPTNAVPDSGLDAAIAQCRKDFATDFVTQEYCIKQQTEPYRRLRGGGW
jgi:hypothetical protein